MTRSSSFAPFTTEATRLLVLGSLPGQQSLAAQRYYAHPQNQFWRLIGAVIGVDLPALPYEERLTALATARVGLWDSVGSAVRPGSLDSAIQDHETNALADLAAKLPQLQAVGFNGALSYKLGAPLLAATGLQLIRLPSSSPANAGMTFEAKREAWIALAAYL